ncbi:MAG TPA: hypothetical protein VLX59_06485, partial [Acidimicrobiales bacterium]|nr:hypothetical protein [Acidimicrobiales bacterium]
DRPQPRTRVVPFAGLPAVLPAETRKVGAAERAAALARRSEGVGRRLAVPLTTRWSYSTAGMDPPRPS